MARRLAFGRTFSRMRWRIVFCASASTNAERTSEIFVASMWAAKTGTRTSTHEPSSSLSTQRLGSSTPAGERRLGGGSSRKPRAAAQCNESISRGSLKGGFSKPLFHCKYLRLCCQCWGTSTTFRSPFKKARKKGSLLQQSQTSILSGRADACFNWQTVGICAPFFLRGAFSSAPSSSSLLSPSAKPLGSSGSSSTSSSTS